MTTKHTPGPWHVEGDHVTKTDHLAKHLIVWPVEGPYALPFEERRANAHLIASAPDLLAALIAAYEAAPFHESGCPREEDTEEVGHIAKGCDCILSVMQAAIAKALGNA